MSDKIPGTGSPPSDLLQERVRHVELGGGPALERQAPPAELPEQPVSDRMPPAPQLDPPPVLRSIQYLFRDMQSVHLLVWTVVGCLIALPLLVRFIGPLLIRLFVLEPPVLFLLLVIAAGVLIYRRYKRARRR